MPREEPMIIKITGWSITTTGPEGLSPITVGEDVVRSIDPDVSALAAKCIAAWTYAEAARVSMVADICHKNRAVLLRDLTTAKTPPREVRAKLKMFTNLSRSGKERDACLAVLDAMAKAEDDRNDLAHRLWAFSPAAPKSLVLVLPSFLHEFDAESADIDEAMQNATQSRDFVALSEAVRRPRAKVTLRDANLVVHTAETLKSLLDETEWAGKASVSLSHLLRGGPGPERTSERSLGGLWWVLRQAAASRQARTPPASTQPPPSGSLPPKS